MSKEKSPMHNSLPTPLDNHQELLDRRTSFIAQQSIKRPGTPNSALAVSTSPIRASIDIGTPLSPTKREMHGLSTSLMTLAAMKVLLVETEVFVAKMSKKQKDSGVYTRMITDIDVIHIL